MEIHFPATIGICGEFKNAPDTDQGEVSVVIAPIKVTSEEDGKLRVITGCNLWQSCHNIACWYSLANRETKKARPRK